MKAHRAPLVKSQAKKGYKKYQSDQSEGPKDNGEFEGDMFLNRDPYRKKQSITQKQKTK